MPKYQIGEERLPARKTFPVLKAMVYVHNLESTKEDDDIAFEKEIDYSNAEDRKWLGQITFWALTNKHSVETVNKADIDLPEVEA